MDNFRDIFERFDEEADLEFALSEKLESIIELDYVEAAKDEYWFDPNTLYNVSEVIGWLQEHYPELYGKALASPDVLEGKDEVGKALQALGYMKRWEEVDEEDLQTPEEIEHWRIATGYYREE